jgi:signal transduction histidine kinase
MESVVGSAAKNTMYQSLIADKRGNNRLKDFPKLKEFLLSPQWHQLQQAFDDFKIKGVHDNFHYQIGNDSTVINMGFSFSNAPAPVKVPADIIKPKNRQPIRLKAIDNKSVLQIDSAVRAGVMQLGLSGETAFALYDYSKDSLISLTTSKEKFKQAAYRSGLYSYNLNYLNKYQLIIPEINSAIIYQMRYYLFSSLLMILLTGVAFYFLLKLIRNQRLYADAKSTFTSNMTHEFKTPVATISVALESITKYQLVNDPEKLQNYLDISRHELQRLNFMIEKVLNLSQEEETSNTIREELYDVQAGLKQVVASMQIQLDNSRSTIQLSLADEPCFINGDPLHLTNVFYNLIDNAIKYAGPQLEMQISCSCSANNVTLAFKDNGPGIASVYQEKVFDRFFRVPGIMDRHNVKGSGLGLHYVKQISSKHGGSISVKSEPGKGSNFIIILPAAI